MAVLLCVSREIECVPDVWCLVEWSNWLTPENIPRRYDTVFYLCCLDGKPSPIFNPSEVSKAEVSVTLILVKINLVQLQ